MNRGGGRHGRLVVGLSVLALVLLGLGAAANGTLEYSRTPGQLQPADLGSGQRVRVAGTVVPGTLVEREGTATFTLEGGGGHLGVRANQAPRGSFRAGQDAVVEGTVGADGVLVADSVMARHGNTYGPARKDHAAAAPGGQGAAP